MKTGTMSLDLRLADFRLQKGDLIVFREWSPKRKRYTGRTLERKVRGLVKFNLAKLNSVRDIRRYGHYLLWLN